jgi:predicted HicB family RNase H-like nuclease
MAALADESTSRAADLIAAALESSLARRLQEMLAEAALELSAQLEEGRVEVRIAGADHELLYVDDEAPVAAEPPEAGASARITLRLPESLKSRVEEAAAARGLSVNTWLVQALGRLLEPRHTGANRHRLVGYGRS